MKLEVFKKLLYVMGQQEEKLNAAYKAGIDLIHFYDDGETAISLLLSVYYGKEGKEWIDWYLYERDSFSNEVNQATDTNNKPICYDDESLWKEVEQCKLNNDAEYTLPIELTMEEKFKMLDRMFNMPKQSLNEPDKQ